MLDNKTIITIGLVISSAIAGYVLWTHVKQTPCKKNKSLLSSDDLKEE